MQYRHTHYSHCEFHLGDNLLHLHFLRHMALRHQDSRFVHGVHECHIAQLREALTDVPNVELIPIEQRPPESRDAWKNAGGYWENHPLRNNFSAFYLDFFKKKARELGQSSPFEENWDLLLDYPALRVPNPKLSQQWDYLLVNSRPCSGQLPAYDRVEYFDPLIERLVRRYHVLVTQPTEVKGAVCTMDFGLTISEIGRISCNCSHHIMVSTGPSWPVLNDFNLHCRRTVLLSRESLNLPGVDQYDSLEPVMRKLESEGWI